MVKENKKKDDRTIKINPISKEAELEIYRQKYEVFRHFDNLRWQIPTLCISAGSLVIGFAAVKDSKPAWWSFIIFGGLSLFSAFAVQRIRDGIEENRQVLTDVAKSIGDDKIPLQKGRFGASWWLCVILVLLGIGAIVGGLFLYKIS